MTRANILQIGLGVFLLGGVGYGVFSYFGLDGLNAGIASEAILISIIFIWVGSYFFRVITGNMTFMEQRKRYRRSYDEFEEIQIQKKFDSMSEEEKDLLIKEMEIDKK